jgi:uncharacterized membrane protein
MPETAAYCPSCGRSIVPSTAENSTRAEGKVGIFPERVAGALAYITFLPAIIYLLLEPYKKNYFVRFHSIQCLLFFVALIGVAAAARVITLFVVLIPILGPLLVVLILVVAGIAAFVLWLVLLVKALQGEVFKLPALGDLAERYAVAA